MMFVDADAIHAGFRGIDEFIEGPVVVLADLDRIREFPERGINPYGLVFLFEVRRQFAVGHQVEHRYFHGGISSQGPKRAILEDLDITGAASGTTSRAYGRANWVCYVKLNLRSEVRDSIYEKGNCCLRSPSEW